MPSRRNASTAVVSWSPRTAELGYEGHICEKGQRDQPLSDEQQTANRTRSKTLSRIEPVCGFLRNSMGGEVICNVAKTRAEHNVE